LQATLTAIGPCDVVIGIPTYNHARTAARVVHAVGAGLAKYLPDVKVAVVNTDAGSTDGTPDRIAEADLPARPILVVHRVDPQHKLTVPYHGVPGRDSACRLLFQIARTLEVKACAVVGGDLMSVTPEWVDRLLRPLLTGDYDVVLPHYRRHKYDGTITSTTVYPLIRSLYGYDLRQPLSSEFGVTGDLAARFLDQAVWDTDLAPHGIDVWMLAHAMTERRRICQTRLGPRLRDTQHLAVDLSSMLVQVVGSLFGVMETHAAHWKTVGDAEPVPLLGEPDHVPIEPVSVNVERMVRAFEFGLQEFASLWEGVVLPDVLRDLQDLRRAAPPFRFPDRLWARVVHEWALSAHRRTMTRDHLLRSLTPLYLGKVASFIAETQHGGQADVDRKIAALCRAFAEDKPYLIAEWDRSSHLERSS
jgi:hypothetical protein